MNHRIHNIRARVDAVSDIAQFPHSRILQVSFVPTSLLRYAYYAFLFSLPFEKADLELERLPLSRLLGLILIAVTMATMVLPGARFRLGRPPKAFWCFAAYLLIYAALGIKRDC